MDKAELLHHRAAILAGEIKRLAQQARLEGDHEVHAQLKAAGRELPSDTGTLDNALNTVRSRLTPEVAAAMRPRIEAEAEEKAADQYTQRLGALVIREQELEGRPTHRYPWITLGATLATIATTTVTVLT